ncbi:MAG: sigma-54 dependent transcriptional regulator, partial [Desulfarculaceae bacterium]
TAYGSIESSVRAMKEGAADYLLKPFDPEQLILLLEKISTQRALLRENLALRQRLSEGDSAGFGDLIGQSPAMLSIFNLIEEISGSEAPVLITGETGTGKELVARAIHNHSRRAFGPYVTINCGAQTESLLESELFGHERGAFTGAVKARRGRLELADGGTLFLDEVGEISQKMQLNLLRVLEDKRFQRVGGSQTLSSDFRVICATHRDLPALIKEENFRQDFYFRINVISVPIPPLRQRPEDIIPLAEHFVDFFARQTGRAPLELDHSARTLLVNYSWPGNVRELRNVMERAVIVAKSPKIQAGQLTFLSVTPETEPPSFTLAQAELNHIHKALEAHDWNITQAAKALGIDRSTLRRKMKKMELQAPT